VSRKADVMRTAWWFHRRLLMAVVATAVLVVSGAAVWAGNHQGGARAAGPSLRAATRPVLPSTDKVPQSELRTADPVQQQVDAELAQAETPAAISAAERFSVPAPGVSTAYPLVPMVDRGDPGTYATAFTTELLNTNFATQSRGALLSWAEFEEAPNTLPGVPASVAGKALVLSLADPDLPGGSPSPVLSAPLWIADSQSAMSQSVTDVQAEIAPDWTRIISQGWQPRDPLMTVEVVTGNLSVVTNGVVGAPQPFSLTVTLGSAAHAGAGFGAVTASDWTLD
jgi:hypothetical protein